MCDAGEIRTRSFSRAEWRYVPGAEPGHTSNCSPREHAEIGIAFANGQQCASAAATTLCSYATALCSDSARRKRLKQNPINAAIHARGATSILTFPDALAGVRQPAFMHEAPAFVARRRGRHASRLPSAHHVPDPEPLPARRPKLVPFLLRFLNLRWRIARRHPRSGGQKSRNRIGRWVSFDAQGSCSCSRACRAGPFH